MNEIAHLCERVGADVDNVRTGIGSDGRIGPAFLFPGPGYGGSCFPKDVQALVQLGREIGHPLRVAEATHRANLDQREHWVQRVCSALDPSNAEVAVWGAAFKAHTDDVRDSPAVYLIDRLRERGAHLRVHDPRALHTARRVLGDHRITWCDDMYAAVDGADALVVATEWPVYRTPDFDRMARTMRRPLLFDSRNLYDAERIERTPFSWWSVGRPPQLREAAAVRATAAFGKA
jgi:UDPglucose 6-dehydrogenase